MTVGGTERVLKHTGQEREAGACLSVAGVQGCLEYTRSCWMYWELICTAG